MKTSDDLRPFIWVGNSFHNHMREAILGKREWYKPPNCISNLSRIKKSDLNRYSAKVISEIANDGLWACQTDEPLSSIDFLNFTSLFGPVIIEPMSEARSSFQEGAILNIVGKYKSTENMSRQPFSEDYLSLHTEGSALERNLRPKYIFLYYRALPALDDGGQTIFASINDVLEEISNFHINILSEVSYFNHPDREHSIVQSKNSLSTISYRDALVKTKFAYKSATKNFNELILSECIEALNKLTDAVYTVPIWGIPEVEENLLLCIDNERWLHGRTAFDLLRSPRHVQRICIR